MNGNGNGNGNGKWALAKDVLDRVKRPQRIMIAGHVVAAAFLVLAIAHRSVDHAANVLFAEGGALAASSLYKKIDENTRITVDAAIDAKKDRAAIAEAVGSNAVDATTSSSPTIQRVIDEKKL